MDIHIKIYSRYPIFRHHTGTSQICSPLDGSNTLAQCPTESVFLISSVTTKNISKCTQVNCHLLFRRLCIRMDANLSCSFSP